ncbi:MAG: hypothetical protein KatS3mg051_2220 [Anaerolineae bacterium]|nr:MAG: hypothetical protein KatS3mg051_2220 [Anaerolineae bacterium]
MVCQLRVAYAVGADYERDLRLPETLMREFQQVSELQAVRDRRFNDARIELLGNLQGLDVPDWLREAITSLRQWRSPARLAALCLRWRERRFPGDDVAYNALESWRQRDRHLWEWQANLRDQAIARRNDLYHQFAAEIARRARVVVLEDLDLTHLSAGDRRAHPCDTSHADDSGCGHPAPDCGDDLSA